MTWIDRAERRFGHLAIPHLIRIIVGFNVLVFVLYKLDPHFLRVLSLDPAAVMRGEVWRLVTYVFIPSIGSPLFDMVTVFFYIWFLWWLGDGLENVMGSFRVNLFYFLGMIGTTVAAFFTGANFATTMVNSSLLFAFAHFCPDEVIYIMALIPAKVKWLAWFTGILLVYNFVTQGWDYRLALVVALANYFLFFGRDVIQAAAHRRGVQTRRSRFEAERRPESEAMHHCTVCGRTELQAPELEFRVAKDGQEYCLEHLPKAPPPAAT